MKPLTHPLSQFNFCNVPIADTNLELTTAVSRIQKCKKKLFKYLLDGNSANKDLTGGSPGLMVMGGDSCSEGCWFESQH